MKKIDFEKLDFKDQSAVLQEMSLEDFAKFLNEHTQDIGDHDPLSTPHSYALIETLHGGQPKLRLNHDDGNEWSYGYCWIQRLGPGEWMITEVYERNEFFFPEIWDKDITLTEVHILQGFKDNIREANLTEQEVT